MLEELYPKAHFRYASLPILGSTLDGFTQFLFQEGYPRKIVRRHIQTAWHVDQRLQSQRCLSLGDVCHEHLRACFPPTVRTNRDIDLTSTVRQIQRYLDHEGLIPPAVAEPTDGDLIAYAAFLRDARGLATVTIARHLATASGLLALCRERVSGDASALRASIVEEFITIKARRFGRESMLHLVAELRSFLRFLALRDRIAPGLDSQVDSPRLYRQEKLPRSLPWQTVQTLLQSIDRSTPIGRRDYAMLLLMATYGLRGCDVVTLRLDDIQWRAGILHVVQSKTDAPLWLPLIDPVSESLLAYLREGRPQIDVREVFVRHRAPAGVLKPTAVGDIFEAWARRSGMAIPFKGAHCIRHSYAVELLRQATPLKTIGDLLGHRSAESTCVYLRLAVDDLREVALDLPSRGTGEVRP